MLDRPAPTHDLIRLREPAALVSDERVPAWVERVLRETPWVVVRRGHVRDGLMPVGVRGPARSQRFAAFLALAEMAGRLSPEDLSARLDKIACSVEILGNLLVGGRGLVFETPILGTQDRGLEDETPATRNPTEEDFHRAKIAQYRKAAVPALAALARIGPFLTRQGHRWGPGGSVGFEIATGLPAATPSSDLDLILRQDHRLGLDDAIDLRAALAEAAAPARVDLMLETPGGGVSLADLAAGPARVLVRTPDGPRLSADPWNLEAGS